MIGRRVRFQNEQGENQGSSKKLKVGTEKDWGRWSPDSLNKERSMRNNKDTIVFFFFSIFGYKGYRSTREESWNQSVHTHPITVKDKKWTCPQRWQCQRSGWKVAQLLENQTFLGIQVSNHLISQLTILSDELNINKKITENMCANVDILSTTVNLSQKGSLYPLKLACPIFYKVVDVSLTPPC